MADERQVWQLPAQEHFWVAIPLRPKTSGSTNVNEYTQGDKRKKEREHPKHCTWNININTEIHEPSVPRHRPWQTAWFKHFLGCVE